MGAKIASVKQHIAFVKAKQHIQDHKNIYLAGGGGVVVGLLLRGRAMPDITIINNVVPEIAPVIVPIFNSAKELL